MRDGGHGAPRRVRPSRNAHIAHLDDPTAPGLRGEWLVDDSSRQSVANDWGHDVHRAPFAVARPASAEDVVRIVHHANEHGFKVAMRGRGHCAYGQAQVADGVVIDSSSARGSASLYVSPPASSLGRRRFGPWGDARR